MFGGQANLLQAINNIFTVYEPEVIAVHTTCLSETIGDDLNQIFDKARKEGKVPEGCTLVGAPTPSYVGSHVTGFSNMVKAMAQLAEPSGKKNGKVNIIPGWVEPADMAEIKRLAALVGVPVTVFPDTSGVLDAPLTGEYKMFPDGGRDRQGAQGQRGRHRHPGHGRVVFGGRGALARRQVQGAVHTYSTCPFGLAATDRFIDVLRTVAGVTVPDAVAVERGQLVDLISDMHQYFYGKRVALWGDPDQLISMCEFLVSLDIAARLCGHRHAGQEVRGAHSGNLRGQAVRGQGQGQGATCS